jgi:serine/threonine protein phosphatase PrpC
MKPTLRVWAATDAGCVREKNEDALCIGNQVVQSDDSWSGYIELSQDQPLLVAVVDGMGGHRGGAVASRIVAEKLSILVRSNRPSPDVASGLISLVNEHVHDHASRNPLLCGMGATAAFLWFGTQTGLCINVGDAKVFRQQDGFLQLRSEDHALQSNDGRRSLLQSLGGTKTLQSVSPSVREEPLRDGRRYLLCTDGLTDEVNIDEIETYMTQPSKQAMMALLNAAKVSGGRDNITLAIVEIHIQD